MALAVHPFPAKMAPSIALNQLRALVSRDSGARLLVVDPMVGSGTTAVAASALGCDFIGTDLDPLAVLIARVSVSDVPPIEILSRGADMAAAAGRLAPKLHASDAYPRGADIETREFVRFWFDLEARRYLRALSDEIRAERNLHVREALMCAFSRTIVTKQAGASLAMDVSHSRPHRAYPVAPVAVFELFDRAVTHVARAVESRPRASRRSAISISQGDARQMKLSDGVADMVLTSPPYLNMIDYLRGHRLALVWFGHSIQQLRIVRSESIGAERVLDAAEHRVRRAVEDAVVFAEQSARVRGMVLRYACDLDRAVSEASRVLKSGGKAVFVVGESRVRGTFIANASLLCRLAQNHGFTIVSRRVRALPANRRYLPPPRASLGGRLDQRMRTEVVLTLNKQ